MSSLADVRLSRRVSDLEPSPIREILSVIERPGMISFAGGLPAAETFPRLDLAQLPAACLQYGATEGDTALRCRVAESLTRSGIGCAPEQVLILSGSQQGIDLAAKLFIDSGTPVAVEAPTYLAALQVFRYFGAALVTLDPRLPQAGIGRGPRPALAYVNPTFQNPTGHCYDASERAAVAAACDELAVPLFEDDPYRDLAYEPCDRAPICARLERASWIYQSSFSKSLAPGLRLGYLAASPDLVSLLTRLKQAADLHSSRLSQWLVLEQLQGPRHAERLAAVVAAYRRKRDVFAAGLRRHFSGLARWELPPGGLFFWLRLSRLLDTRELLPQAIARGVAFMPGEFFFPDRPQASGTLRLNFSHATEPQVERGLAILAELVSAS
jgi:DNA-binding transcriptional MocR family regulator